MQDCTALLKAKGLLPSEGLSLLEVYLSEDDGQEDRESVRCFACLRLRASPGFDLQAWLKTADTEQIAQTAFETLPLARQELLELDHFYKPQIG